MAGKVQSNNYIVVQGWMVTELGLKGGELLIYAIIYGFSQAEDQGYTGTVQYLADWTSSSQQSVRNWLKALVTKGLLTRREYVVNNLNFIEYRSKFFSGGVKIFEGGTQNFIPEGVKNFDPDNTNDNTNDNSIDRESAHAHTRESDRPEQKREEDPNDDSEPSLEDVKAYIKKHGLKVDAVTFVKYYESLGVRLGGMKLKSWRARLELWDRRERLSENENGEDRKRRQPPGANCGAFDTDDFFDAAVRRTYKTDDGPKKVSDNEINEVLDKLKNVINNA